MRALANPLRLRILHHVRVLVRGGFLEAGKVRPGRRGALERPYRATGKSWRIRMRPGRDYTASVLDAVRDELDEAGPAATLTMLRLGVRLAEADLEELRHRVGELGDEFV